MRVRISTYWLSFLIVVAFAAMIPSCKSPMTPATLASNPALTLILPDSARVFDTVVFRAHYSDSIASSWKFEWQFGDSAKASTKDTSISHVYDSAGTYTVLVSIVDTNGKTIAKQSGQIKIMPLNAPTLALTVPDTNYWGDSCVMSVSSSQPLKPGWKFSWSLGDSTTVSGVDSVLHYYLTPGIYYVIVNLDDTVRHILIASQSAKTRVTARQFDLELLKTLPWVELSWNATMAGQSSGTECSASCFSPSPIPLQWNGSNFSMDTFNSYNYSIPNTTDSGGGGISIGGNVDSSQSQLLNFSSGGNCNSNYYAENGGSYAFYSSSDNFSVQSVPFKEESDSDMVFEALGVFIKNASYNYSWSCRVRAEAPSSSSGHAVWSNLSANPFVIIRFHK